MNKRTALFAQHQADDARIVPFAGWDMPLHYGSQVAEHNVVRTGAGMFDVSHMTVLDVAGPASEDNLRRWVANDVARLEQPGDALYGAMLNECAGVVDDLIVYRADDGFRMVTNAGTRDKVLAWLDANSEGEVVVNERALSIIAVQGPDAIARFTTATGIRWASDLKPFTARDHGTWFVARTGYTGESGVEVILPDDDAQELWRALRAVDVAPVGLGARDTLRLEAGLNLYGQDMDDDVNPLEANMGWTIRWRPEERAFIGRPVLENVRNEGANRDLVGIVLDARGVMRTGQVVRTSRGDGVVTSGIFSPTLGYSIALARLPAGVRGNVEVIIRDKPVPAYTVKVPFVRYGKRVFKRDE